jgi:hypothetical protein
MFVWISHSNKLNIYSSNNCFDFLADMRLIIRQELNFIHDGVPAHLSRYLQVSESKVSWLVDRSRYVNCLATTFTDLNPLDFYFWGN